MSSSTPNVLLCGTFNVTAQFEPNATGTNLVSFSCGYDDIGSALYTRFVKYVLFSINAFQFVGSGFPPSYRGRLAIASRTTIVISNVTFQDKGTRYSCELEYYDPAITASKILHSKRLTITSVYGK